MRRVLYVWLPRLATDRMTRPDTPDADRRDHPFALVTETGNTATLSAVTRAAEVAGVFAGMPLADARAVCPALVTRPADPDADLAALGALADRATRYTPWTAIEPPGPGGEGGLWLDITGCAHLFGGEAALARDLRERMRAAGFSTVRVGLADTRGAAWAAARFLAGAGGETPGLALLPDGAQRQLLANLPVEALRLPPDTVDTLHRLGLRRIADLLALPRAPLAARLGPVVARRLDQALGREPEPFTPRAPAVPWRKTITFPEPIGRTEDVERAIETLCRALRPRLEQADRGARRLLLEMARVDGSILRRVVGTSRPTRDPEALARLFQETLDGLDVGFGIESMALTLTVVEPLGAEQHGFVRGPGQTADATVLLFDRLRARLGPGRVIRPAPRQSHVPEAAVTTADRAPAAADTWPATAPRPSRLLAPEPVEVLGGNLPPVRFRWRRRVWTVVRAEGPERIAPEWWHGAEAPAPNRARDYWRVEDAAGHRLWLAREAGAGWTVRGVFA
ncbi:DNA polymerase Y family protein [uncultured Rhodospira sp.]|uniref:Y-family DNA polymerase n=1 Tax=uncultured Rhodospira sp. TaxID=1936189 RepID=UPI002637C967|nr:DNA polymerase Y family protein [uncultured Rhodospira sp.]